MPVVPAGTLGAAPDHAAEYVQLPVTENETCAVAAADVASALLPDDVATSNVYAVAKQLEPGVVAWTTTVKDCGGPPVVEILFAFVLFAYT